MTEFMASGVYRLVAVPLIAAGLGAFIRYHACKLQGDAIRLGEVLGVWPELFIAAILSLLTLSSDIASRRDERAAESVLTLATLSIVFLLMLWVTATVAGIPRSAGREAAGDVLGSGEGKAAGDRPSSGNEKAEAVPRSEEGKSVTHVGLEEEAVTGVPSSGKKTATEVS